MDLTKLVINEAEIEFLSGPLSPLAQHVSGLADRVVNQAIQNASNRPGPRIRTGDLVEKITKQPGADEDGFFIDVGSPAEHRGYPYPSRLETGQDGVRYPWLVPALVEVIGGA
jgi:hypothetical protein